MTDETTTTGSETGHDNPHAMTAHHSHSDTVVLPVIGTVTVPGGIYSVVFGGLGILTVLEVVLAQILIEAGIIKSIVLLAIAFLKALLVVMFYMHLRQDNRLFRVVLGLPLVIVILCVLYLLAVPTGGGLGYLSAGQ